jgi:hypothetical protein
MMNSRVRRRGEFLCFIGIVGGQAEPVVPYDAVESCGIGGCPTGRAGSSLPLLLSPGREHRSSSEENRAQRLLLQPTTTQYVGIDLHQATSSICVRDVDGRITQQTAQTSAPAILGLRTGRPGGEVLVTFEEGTQSHADAAR